MPEEITTPVMLSVKETAQHIKLPVHFVRSLVKQNKVKYVMAGKKTLINLKSVVDYLNMGDYTSGERDMHINGRIRKVGA